MNGVVVVDKPSGPTSHDVVMRLRRALGTRRVGHAGTLDPMASGVLVALVGEGTKLGPYATAQDKEYLARVAFGRATSTLDALGETTAEAVIPGWLHDELGHVAAECLAGAGRLAAAIAAELARTSQAPPVFSAIKVDGRKSYDLARAGQPIDLAERPVEVHALDLITAGGGGDSAFVELRVRAAKGYYVRSLARDLGEHLGVAAHLASLRRTASGPFTIADAVSLDEPARLRSAVLPLDEGARRCLAAATLTPLGAQRARLGQALDVACFVDPAGDAPTAWFDPEGRLCAIGQRGVDGTHRVRRGFTNPEATG